MDELDYLDLPPVECPQVPDTYTYDAGSKPSRFIRIYKTSKDNDYGQDEKPRVEDKPV